MVTCRKPKPFNMPAATPLRAPEAQQRTTGLVLSSCEARLASVSRGMLTLPGLLPPANSAGERTSTITAPAAASKGSFCRMAPKRKWRKSR